MKRLKICALACSCVLMMGFAFAGCTSDPKAEGKKPETEKPALGAMLTEEEYVDAVGKAYDGLLVASGDASEKMDSVNATEEQKIKIQRLKVAMDAVGNVIPLYDKFAEFNPPEKYAEAQKLIVSGAAASSEVLRLTIEMSEVAEDEDKIAEVMLLQSQLEDQTKPALDFSKGLVMVLGDEKVGTGDSAK